MIESKIEEEEEKRRSSVGDFEREFRKLETLEVLDYQTATKTAFEWLCMRTRT